MFGRHSITNLSSQNIFILANNLISLTSQLSPIYSFFSDYSTLFLTILSSLYLSILANNSYFYYIHTFFLKLNFSCLPFFSVHSLLHIFTCNLILIFFQYDQITSPSFILVTFILFNVYSVCS